MPLFYASDVSDEFVDAVGERVGMHAGAWDMVDPKEIIAAAVHCYMTRLDAPKPRIEVVERDTQGPPVTPRTISVETMADIAKIRDDALVAIRSYKQRAEMLRLDLVEASERDWPLNANFNTAIEMLHKHFNICSQCNGSGLVLFQGNEVECPSCLGTGQILLG